MTNSLRAIGAVFCLSLCFDPQNCSMNPLPLAPIDLPPSRGTFWITPDTATIPRGGNAAFALHIALGPTVSRDSVSAALLLPIPNVHVSFSPSTVYLARGDTATDSVRVSIDPAFVTTPAGILIDFTVTDTANRYFAGQDGQDELIVRVARGSLLDFDIATSPYELYLSPGATDTETITSSSLGGPTTTITLSVVPTPPGLTFSFIPPSITSGATAHLVVTADPGATDALAGVYTIQGSGVYSRTAEFTVVIQMPWKPVMTSTENLHAINAWPPGLGTIVVAAGDAGTILRSSDGGLSWSQQNAVAANLRSVVFSNNGPGTAVGDNGTIIRSEDGGLTWNPQTSGTTANLSGVAIPTSGIDTARVYAVGAGGTILGSLDGGWTWKSINTLSGIPDLRGVSCSGSGFTVFAAGATGTILMGTNTGTQWTKQTSGVTVSLNAIANSGSTLVIAVGDNGTILRTTTGGTTWTQASSGTTVNLHGISYADPEAYVTGDNGTILNSTDGGQTWIKSTANPPADLEGVTFFSWPAPLAVGGIYVFQLPR